ncbi:MAG: putative lipid II flippase FtsW [Coriobacteriaceae bacterium]|jgi:cell division protein FtsW|nr:putative lipid II flippase FtsW [Coriobacteriaceae bacterium]
MARQAKNTPQTMNSLPTSLSPAKATSALSSEVWVPRIFLVLSAFTLLLIGFLMVYSTSSIVAIDEGSAPTYYLVRQLGFAAIGIAACFAIVKYMPYHRWLGQSVWVFWGIAVILLACTALIGTEELGAKRWLNIGPVSLQPSEFAKIAFILMAARILTDFRNEELNMKAALIHMVVLILLPVLFLYKMQSDLGTTLICFMGILAVMWLGEVRLNVIIMVAVFGLLFALAASIFTEYRSDRLIFLNPWNDGSEGLGAGYQLIHSFYAFSEGGLFGVGLGNSREKFLYLPYADTDFIFAIIGEELGLLGAVFVVVLFLVFLYAGMRIARNASDNFGMILAGSCTIAIVFQAFLNMGCVIGVLPTTGKPLPFISLGGSSLIAILCMVGIVLSVSRDSSEPDIYEQRRANLRVVRSEGATSSAGLFKEKSSSRQASSSAPARQMPSEVRAEREARARSRQGRKTSSKTGSRSRESRKRR